ncbi:MAG: aldehyde dehydrogenase family protein [Gemmatimonadaceae bacterium]
MVPSNIAVWRKRVTITQEPYGVIGIISPWNYPLLLPASSALAALTSTRTQSTDAPARRIRSESRCSGKRRARLNNAPHLR